MLLAAALRYAELGYPVFPSVPGEKDPLCAHGVHDATTDTEQIEEWWSARPNANIGLSAAGLLVVDVEAKSTWLADDPEKLAELATAPLSLTANGGRQYLFRRPPGKQWRNSVKLLDAQVDTRTDGGYIVVAPSVLAGRKAYRWAPGMALEDRPEKLPEPPAWLAAELDRLATGSPTSSRDAAGTADANPIPSGQRNATLARLAGTMRRVGMSHDEIATALRQVNQDRCVPPLANGEVERITASVTRYAPDEVATALAENHWDQMYAESSVDEAPTGVDPGPVPDELLSVPGFVDDVMRYTLETAPYPERALAFCGALALQALLAGRKVRDEADNRTNLYILGLANSGAGKDYPRKVNQKILLEAGIPESLGDTFASGEGIEDRLFGNPAVLFQTDEIDGLMTKINLAREARHEGIMNALLKMYTSASSLYPMRVKAGASPGIIDQPCLCIFGTAIPKHYYEALSLKMLTNGFFARMLVLETGKRGLGQDAVVRDVPGSIRSAAQWWVEFAPGEKRSNLAKWHPIPRVVIQTPEAAATLRAFREAADHEYSRAEDQNDPAGMAIWARAHEKARRLALVYACSANHRAPQITADAAEWACRFVEHQTRRMLFMASLYVCDTEFDQRCKRLVELLLTWHERHGDAWMPFRDISRKLRWTRREHEEVREALIDQERIKTDAVTTTGRPRLVYRLASFGVGCS